MRMETDWRTDWRTAQLMRMDGGTCGWDSRRGWDSWWASLCLDCNAGFIWAVTRAWEAAFEATRR